MVPAVQVVVAGQVVVAAAVEERYGQAAYNFVVFGTVAVEVEVAVGIAVEVAVDIAVVVVSGHIPVHHSHNIVVEFEFGTVAPPWV